MSDKLTVEGINKMAETPRGFIDLCEKEFDEKIKSVAAYVKKNKIKIIFLSGPTSSGKTTFTKKMAGYLGRGSLVLSLDDYYKEQEEIPLNKDGSYNYETISAINTKRFREDVKKLLSGEETALPGLDFKTGERSDESRKVRLKGSSTVIVEGLHALNPKIYGACGENCLKIFISPMRKVFNGKKIISSYDIRFIRRMVRDNFFRNAGAEITVKMWKSVRSGEKIYMQKYKDNADFLIDTFMPYELCVMKKIALSQLSGIEKTIKVRRLANILGAFEEIDKKYIPKTSILNEFIKL